MSLKRALEFTETHGANFRVISFGYIEMPVNYKTTYFTKFNHAISAYKHLKRLYPGNVFRIELRNERNPKADFKNSRWKEWITLLDEVDKQNPRIREDSVGRGKLFPLNRIIEMIGHIQEGQNVLTNEDVPQPIKHTEIIGELKWE